MKFKIYDWAWNHCFPTREFETFGDAWSFLYTVYESIEGREFHDQMNEYGVTNEEK